MENLDFETLKREYTIADYIGERVRRISFLVKKAGDGKYHHLFSIVEHLFPKMQDYDTFKTPKSDEYIDFIKDADGDKDKVFFVVDFPVLTEAFLKNPIGNYAIGGTWCCQVIVKRPVAGDTTDQL